MSDSPIDWAALSARFKNRQSFIDEIIATALASHNQTPEKLRDAAIRNDSREMAFLAHTVKGLAGNLAANRLQDLAQKAEASARDNRSDTPILVRELAEQMTAVLAELANRSAK